MPYRIAKRAGRPRNFFTPANIMRVGNYVRQGVKMYNRYRGRGSQTDTGNKRVTDGVGVSTQYDRKTIYLKKKMPYRKKQAWKKFSQKVNAVLEKNLGTKTFLFNRFITGSNAAAAQGILTIGLYSNGGLADAPGQNYCGLKDLFEIANNDPMDETGKIKFKSAVLDVTFQASGENTYGTELDVYELWFNGKDCPFSNVNDIFAQAASDTTSISGTGTSISITQRGVTPFDIPQAFSIGHFSVYKKIKYLLPPGGTATYQIRDPRLHIFNKRDILDANGRIAPSKKVFRVLYAIYKPVAATALATVTLNAGVTRKYSYYVMQSNATTDQIVS